MAERSRDWMAQAQRDLETARWNAEGGFYEWACFAAHQAAEKGLKAAYAKLGGAAWGHSVAALLVGLREKVEVDEEVVGLGRMLDRFYLPTRYPNGWETGSPKDYYALEDAQDAIARAHEVLRFCDGLLAG
ncbi:MAG: HEPN domain-containing protein [Actinomycetota bacterium]